MSQISVNVGTLQSNVETAKFAVSLLSDTHLKSLDLKNTNTRPFVQISDLDKKLNGIISKYASLAGRDAEQFGHVSTEIQAADQASANGISAIP